MMRGQVLARRPENESEDYLRAGEAAEILHVSPKTMSRWAKEGRVPHIITLGGHRRFRASEIRTFLEQVEDSERI